METEICKLHWDHFDVKPLVIQRNEKVGLLDCLARISSPAPQGAPIVLSSPWGYLTSYPFKFQEAPEELWVNCCGPCANKLATRWSWLFRSIINSFIIIFPETEPFSMLGITTDAGLWTPLTHMCPALPRLTLDPKLHPGNSFRTEERCVPAKNVMKPYRTKPFAQGAPATQVILMLSQKILPKTFVSTSR